MKKLWTVTKNELLRYFISPLAYVYLVAFLILNAAAAFYFGHFFERGQASLEVMFWYQPWLYLLFISGISMRLWAEEFRNKTIVQIMTMPVSAEVLVWGKFLASWLFCAIALLLTFPFWATVNILGKPDNTVILISYLGSLTLAGCMLAISQTMSALTKNQVIALVLSVAANLMFFWSGIEFVLSFFRLFLPDYMIDTIASFSFLTHFSSITQGLVELRDVLFFTSVILLFNFTTVLIVSFKTSGTSAWLKSTSRTYYITAWFMLVLGFMGFNLLANNLTRGTQIDFSEDKLFTLDKNTVEVLQNLPEPVTAKLYYSSILEQRNPAMRQMFDKIRMLLNQYKNSSNGRFDYRIYHPQSLDNIEDRAIADGIQPIPLIDINQNALFGLTVADSLTNKKVIPYFSTARMPFLEQDLTSIIYELSHRKKTAAIITSLPIGGGGTDNMIAQPWEISRKISEFYNITYVHKPEDLQNRPDVLIMINPQQLSDEMTAAIKEYSENYGNILLLLDSAAEATRLYSSINYPFMPPVLNGLDEFWGFRFYNEYAVADLDNSITVDATSNYKNNPAFTQDVIQFKLKGSSFNRNHPITKHLQTLLMSSASVILPTEGSNVDFIPLLRASTNSALMPISVVYDGLNPRQILSSFKPDENPKILAAAIHGKNPDNQFNLVVVGDTDFIYDNFWASSQTFLEQTYFFPLFNNADFVLNALDYLTNNDDLMNLRGKSAKNREFSGIEKLRKLNIFEYKIKEEQIFKQIDEVKQQLSEIWGKRNFEERQTFTADELALISGIRKQLDSLRKDLSNVRILAGQNINRIAMAVKFVNIFAVPLLLSLLLLIYRLKKRHQKTFSVKLKINSELLKLSAVGLFILALGTASVFLFNQSDIQKYENKPLFPDLPEHINEVQTISIKTHNEQLTFELKDGVWHLKEHPDFPVLQERIRSFLSAMMEARFYEKKANKAEQLAIFGLQPIEADNSPNTRIELDDKNKSPVQTFEVGKYNIELGRGSSAAYIKFDGQFQVWLAEADFIDLSADWHNWTYSNLWDLRFGRLESFNQNSDASQIAELMKHALNTPFISTADKLKKTKSLNKINLKVEDGNEVTLQFYKSDNAVWVKYNFKKEPSDKHLAFFAPYAKDKYFEIANDKWEQIQNAIK